MKSNLKAVLFASVAWGGVILASAAPAFAGDIQPISPDGKSIVADNNLKSKVADADKTAKAINNVISRANQGIDAAQKSADNAGALAQKAQDSSDRNAQDIAANKSDIAKVSDTADQANTTANGAAKVAVKNSQDIYANSKRIDQNGSAINGLANGDANDSQARESAREARQQADGNTQNIQNLANGASNDSVARQGVANNSARIDAVNQNIADTSAADRAYTDNSAAKTLSQANGYTDQKVGQLSHKVDRLKSRVDSGVAGATALASIPFSGISKNSFGGSIGVANSKAAGAVGYQRNFNKHWSARATVAFGDHYAQGGVGGSYNW